jgi:hypothetical protein
MEHQNPKLSNRPQTAPLGPLRRALKIAKACLVIASWELPGTWTLAIGISARLLLVTNSR